MKVKKEKKQTEAQRLLAIHLKELGIETVPEFKFLTNRSYRFDLFWMAQRVGFECDGGMYSGGHRHGEAIEIEHEKDRLAQLNGYRIFRFTNRQVLCGEAKEWIKEHMS